MRSLGRDDEDTVKFVGVGHDCKSQRGRDKADCNQSFFEKLEAFQKKLEI